QAKLTGRLAVCAGTTGPGSTHLVAGLYEAARDHAPVLALSGDMPRRMQGIDFFQTTKPDLLFRDVSLYTETITSPDQALGVIHQAIAAAYAGRGVAHLTLPQDVIAACLFSRPCSACTRFYKSSLLTADIKGQSFKRLRPNFCRTSKSKSSNAPITPKGLSFCRDAGLSSAPSRGSIAVAAWPRISKISPETHSLFSASPRFVSCSESFVWVNELFGPTLKLS